MQRGSLALMSRKEGPDVWQFRWSEKDLHGVRVQLKRVIGTVERYPDGAAARTAMTTVLAELNFRKNGGDDETRTRDLCRDSSKGEGGSDDKE
jgi:integrase